MEIDAPARADELLKQLTVSLYAPPYDKVRHEPAYPDLDNPLHLAALLIDGHAQIKAGGVLAWLESDAGRHLDQTATALERVGAPMAASVLRRVQAVMRTHGVTLASLRADGTGLSAFQLAALDAPAKAGAFTADVQAVSDGFDPFVGLDHREDPWRSLCGYIAQRLEVLRLELARRRTIPPVA